MRIWTKMILPVVLAASAWAAPAPCVSDGQIPNQTQASSGCPEPGKITKVLSGSPFSTSVPGPSSMLLIATGLICFGITKKFRANG